MRTTIFDLYLETVEQVAIERRKRRVNKDHCLCNGTSESLLCISKNAGLGIVIPLPSELASRAVSEPDIDSCQVLYHRFWLSLHVQSL